ncbi:hypothetical protein, variant [Aphanomyces invadans]|uniref:Intimal thickness related receptor IRP domain-containing protein n=1 Tax=Aphanomyces invadans TaxID=157072 RepID=A0A024TY44_9STRA|nr:hypothetical protein, variant [Aphanomyces invadans]ETV98889.1 hypothetical protein, variant [Aphanomyces invadans]|eukprot:XP_008872316.1 hypothetical protein, variant [Aphanomyces invadans]
MSVCVLDDQVTCCFGLYKNNSICALSNTVASLSRVENDALRIGCLVFGIVALAACLCKLRSIRQNDGSTIQRRVYYFMTVAALTFIGRAPDPRSHERIYHPVVSGLIIDICSAAIYSVIVLYTAFYARLVAPPARAIVCEHYIRGFTGLGFFLTWFIYVVVRPAYLLRSDRNIFDSWQVLVQFSMAPLVLFATSTTALHYGLHAYRRLSLIREANKRFDVMHAIRQETWRQLHDLYAALPPSPALGSTASPSQSHDPPFMPIPIVLPTLDDQPAIPMMPLMSKSHSISSSVHEPVKDNKRVLKVLVIMEVCAVVNIGLQIALLVKYIRDGCQLKQDLVFATAGVGAQPYTFDFPTFSMLQVRDRGMSSTLCNPLGRASPCASCTGLSARHGAVHVT